MLLLRAGGDPNAAVRKGRTPLLVALDNFESDIARSLIEHGADSKSGAVGEDGTNALTAAVVSGYEDSVFLLIEKGADVNQRHRFGFTPLMQAAKRGHVEILKALIEAEADINTADDYGDTALIQTVKWSFDFYKNKPSTEDGLKDITNLLLLHAWESYPRVFRLLLGNGANLHAKNRNGETALCLSARTPELHKVLAEAVKDHSKSIQDTK